MEIMFLILAVIFSTLFLKRIKRVMERCASFGAAAIFWLGFASCTLIRIALVTKDEIVLKTCPIFAGIVLVTFVWYFIDRRSFIRGGHDGPAFAGKKQLFNR